MLGFNAVAKNLNDVVTVPAGYSVTVMTRLGAPVATPSKFVAIGLNYKDHAAEMNKPLPAEPLMFIKPSTAVIGPDDVVLVLFTSGSSGLPKAAPTCAW